MTIDIFESAQRLIKAATGEIYGDGEIVMDIGKGYAEPGYHYNEKIWVLGNWNNKSRFDNLENKWIDTDTMPSRLNKALERIGVECEWYDEWGQCEHCEMIFRISGDSYFWQPYFVRLEDGDYLCGDCANDPDFIEDVLFEFVNNPDKATTFIEESRLVELGWTRYNKEQWENGWHPHQTDNPVSIKEQINKEMPNHDVLFYIDENSQFYLGFSAFTKPAPGHEDMARQETDYVGFDTGRGE